MFSIKNVAVIGAGVMGSQIAAHLANCGLKVMLFDLDRDTAEAGKKASGKIKPAAFFDSYLTRSITTFGIDNDLHELQNADWICEAIPERLDWKQELFQKIATHISSTAILSTNTSGLPATEIAKILDDDKRQKFFVTHFFNPPRYLHLLELVSLSQTNPDIFAKFAEFAEAKLGKGVVIARDTTNFIANRIGVFAMMRTLKLAIKQGLTIEEVDLLTGSLIGRPKSATFRTADIVGLDTLLHVTKSTADSCPDDPWIDVFTPPDILKNLVKNGSIGQKSGVGFYKKEFENGIRQIHSIDLRTAQYSESRKALIEGLQVWRKFKNTADRIKAIFYSDDKYCSFVTQLLAETLIYTAYHQQEISGGELGAIDRALKWGFGWELGPFEIWDALDPALAVRKMNQLSMRVPAWVIEMLSYGFSTFYSVDNDLRQIYNPLKKCISENKPPNASIDLELIKRGKSRSKNVLYKSWSASILRLDSEVGCLQFHSVLQPSLHPIDQTAIEVLQIAPEIVDKFNLKGLVISHSGEHFCAGANLQMILGLCAAGKAAPIEKVAGLFQQTMLGLRYAPFPVVAAPFGMCLGGGMELSLACDRIVAHAELYGGLVEAGVGLIPAGGGCLRMLLRIAERMAGLRPGSFPPVQKCFEIIAFARVSSSALEAQTLGFLAAGDKIEINRDRLLEHARREVLLMSKNYEAPVSRQDLCLPGIGGLTAMLLSIDSFRNSGKISEHDKVVAAALATVLCAGESDGFAVTNEEEILALEREHFARLCLMPATQARLKHMLKTGKPLRN
jgi:3-hydroxyacyl-CoA dehydrogenase